MVATRVVGQTDSDCGREMPTTTEKRARDPEGRPDVL